MNKIIVIAIVLIVGWYGNSLYKQNNFPFKNNSETNFYSDKQEKCITKDGRVLYGRVPKGTICERLEPVKGSITIVPGHTSSSYKESNDNAASFQCDGRQHCSQMKSRAEA